MRLYLDDNMLSPHLAALLQRAGHTVVLPADVGLPGASDPRHLSHAIQHGLTLLTANYRDFRDLHELVITAGGSHSGVLLVHFDNDPKRDMKPHEIARAITRLEAAGVPLANQLHAENHWR
jgi:predicted nuclease of predicted toxin-antitoxin system